MVDGEDPKLSVGVVDVFRPRRQEPKRAAKANSCASSPKARWKNRMRSPSIRPRAASMSATARREPYTSTQMRVFSKPSSTARARLGPLRQGRSRRRHLGHRGRSGKRRSPRGRARTGTGQRVRPIRNVGRVGPEHCVSTSDRTGGDRSRRERPGVRVGRPSRRVDTTGRASRARRCDRKGDEDTRTSAQLGGTVNSDGSGGQYFSSGGPRRRSDRAPRRSRSRVGSSLRSRRSKNSRPARHTSSASLRKTRTDRATESHNSW